MVYKWTRSWLWKTGLDVSVWFNSKERVPAAKRDATYNTSSDNTIFTLFLFVYIFIFIPLPLLASNGVLGTLFSSDNSLITHW